MSFLKEFVKRSDYFQGIIKKYFKYAAAFLLLLLIPVTKVFAHEQYVLTREQINSDLADKNIHVLDALNNPENLKIAIFVGIGITVVGIAYFFFQYSKWGKLLTQKLDKLENLGHFLIRASLGVSLIASAYYHSFLGPEIPVTKIFLGNLLIPIMYILGVCLLFGIFTRVVSLFGFFILLASTFVYHEYMVTYFNYYGEYLALIIFGTYYLAVDQKFFGISKLIRKHKDLEILILRVTYGISVLYPAITIKLLHPAVIVEIYNKYQMGRIWWLFPQDALLTALGTGMAQILVGILIIFAFETRLAAFATFLLYLGSIVFFQEAVWPHIVLLALAFYFVINGGGKFTFDNFIEKRFFTKGKVQPTN